MRHLKTTKHLNRTASHRKALTANLSTALFEKKRIVTTLAKAKFCQPKAERFITFAKKGTIAARRHVLRFLPRKDAVKILFDEIAPKYKNRNGGYTRIIKLGYRKGDAAPMAVLELVEYEDKVLTEKIKHQEAKKARREKRREEEKRQAKEATSPSSKPAE